MAIAIITSTMMATTIKRLSYFWTAFILRLIALPVRSRSAGATMASGDLTFSPDLAPFTLGHGSPDPELLAGNDGEFETLGSHRTLPADLFCGARGCTSFREEQVGIRAATIGEILPGQIYALSLQNFYEVRKHVYSVDVVITIM